MSETFGCFEARIVGAIFSIGMTVAVGKIEIAVLNYLYLYSICYKGRTVITLIASFIFLMSLIMKPNSHCGGEADDGQQIWD